MSRQKVFSERASLDRILGQAHGFPNDVVAGVLFQGVDAYGELSGGGVHHLQQLRSLRALGLVQSLQRHLQGSLAVADVAQATAERRQLLRRRLLLHGLVHHVLPQLVNPLQRGVHGRRRRPETAVADAVRQLGSVRLQKRRAESGVGCMLARRLHSVAGGGDDLGEEEEEGEEQYDRWW